MNVKAEAYQECNQAAVVDKLITGMPEVVRALAAPLANVDKITVDLHRQRRRRRACNKITGDITKMAAQMPALFETPFGHADDRAVRQSANHRRQEGKTRRQAAVTNQPTNEQTGRGAADAARNEGKEHHHGTTGTRSNPDPRQS